MIPMSRALIDPAGKQYVTAGPAVHQGLERGVVFDRVSFSYDKADDPALTDASFTIPAGRTTALVGLSGGGKSTIIKLILRFEDPTDGTILLDGRPLPDFDLASWRSQLALVSQDVYLFNATVRENIAYGRLDAAQDDVATIAGIFYGRAWRDRHRLLSSATTHTLVDVIWSLWFR